MAVEAVGSTEEVQRFTVGSAEASTAVAVFMVEDLAVSTEAGFIMASGVSLTDSVAAGVGEGGVVGVGAGV